MQPMSDELQLPLELCLYFDGACEPTNPGGVATYGWLIKDPDGKTLAKKCGVVCEGKDATNNRAEWCALGFGLRYLLDQKWTGKLTIQGDSQLVICQLTGDWACNKPHLIKLRARCLEILKQLGNDYKTDWLPREQNEECDELSRYAYERYTGKSFPIRYKKRKRNQWPNEFM